MILTYHQAIELMSYLPMASPVALPILVDQSELAHVHQPLSDLQTLVLTVGTDEAADLPEMLYTRKIA